MIDALAQLCTCTGLFVGTVIIASEALRGAAIWRELKERTR